MTSDPRIAILPRGTSSQVTTAAVARGGWAVSLLLCVLTVPVLVDVLAAAGRVDALPVPLAANLVMIALNATFGWRFRLMPRVVQAVGGLVCASAFMVSLLGSGIVLADGKALNGDGTFLLNRLSVALVLLGPLALRPLSGLFWASVGLGLSLCSFGITFLVTGVPLFLGWGVFTTWGVYAIAYAVLSIVRASQSVSMPDLVRLEEETRRMAFESQFEQRAAAVIHDTILGDLTAIMNVPDELDDRARERFRADVAMLEEPSWLRDAEKAPVAIDGHDAALRNGAVALASEMQWRGLDVELTGDNDAVVRLSEAALAAVLAAMRACLENVLAHSGVTSAQLVAGGDESEVTYMVVDHGVGFEPSAVPADRLGLRHSVVDRVEAIGGTVRIWSNPGSGTSILITAPTLAATEGES